MDVLWSKDLVDDNAFARNPVWSQMNATGQPPDPCAFCPCGDEDPQAWKAAANCTHQTLHTNSSVGCFGHWNWFPVAYEGTLTWGGHSNSFYDDDDYYMEVKRNDRSIETSTRNGLHIEFSSDETVDHWDGTNTWWDDFHHNYVDHNDQAAAARINGNTAIVIGQLGLDSQHDVHSELNPVYVMFVHVQDDPANDRWAFFVRNWGNEGYCGDNQEYLEPIQQNEIQIRLPRPGATPLALSDNVFVYGDDANERNQQSWTYQLVQDAVVLVFSLRDPAKQVGFMGDLTINWSGGGAPKADMGYPSGRPPSERQPSAALTTDNDGDMALKSKLERLDSATQQLLRREVRDLVQHPRSQLKRGTLAASPRERVKPAAPYPDYGSIVRSVRDPASLARKARAREFILSFLRARGIE